MAVRVKEESQKSLAIRDIRDTLRALSLEDETAVIEEIFEIEPPEPCKRQHAEDILLAPTGNKIATIKLVRDLTGLGLVDAKNVVEQELGAPVESIWNVNLGPMESITSAECTKFQKIIQVLRRRKLIRDPHKTAAEQIKEF